jgi:hypothetical protein
MSSGNCHLIFKRLSMKRLIGSFMLLVFTIGALVLPAIHEISGDELKVSHQQDSCQICQIAHLPKDLAVVDSGLVIVPPQAGGPVLAAPNSPLLSFQRDPTQARAPPAV